MKYPASPMIGGRRNKKKMSGVRVLGRAESSLTKKKNRPMRIPQMIKTLDSGKNLLIHVALWNPNFALLRTKFLPLLTTHQLWWWPWGWSRARWRTAPRPSPTPRETLEIPHGHVPRTTLLEYYWRNGHCTVFLPLMASKMGSIKGIKKLFSMIRY